MIFIRNSRAGILFMILFTCINCSTDSESDTSYLESGDSEYPLYQDNTDEKVSLEENSINIPYSEMYGNTITIPVKLNGMSLDMIFDTGASSTCITLAEAQYLYEKGNLTNEDILDIQQFKTADGSITAGLRIILRDVSIGDKINLHDIEAIIVQNQKAPLLLGQSVMKKFREITVDRENKVIKFIE